MIADYARKAFGSVGGTHRNRIKAQPGVYNEIKSRLERISGDLPLEWEEDDSCYHTGY